MTTPPAHGTHTKEIASGVISTALDILREAGGLLENVPYAEAIAGIVGKLFEIKEVSDSRFLAQVFTH